MGSYIQSAKLTCFAYKQMSVLFNVKYNSYLCHFARWMTITNTFNKQTLCFQLITTVAMNDEQVECLNLKRIKKGKPSRLSFEPNPRPSTHNPQVLPPS